MGSSFYDADAHADRMAFHARTGTSAFKHDADIRAGKKTVGVDDKLDPSKPNKAGKNVRESFDSKEHPKSRPIAVLFDVTGSMHSVPQIFVKKLDKLMAALVKKGYVEDPQILFGAIGDATCDRVPLQIGQFESGNEMDDALTSIYLEGGGGGQQTESYELAMYYMARHTDLDSINKRGEKGFLFLLGDELPYEAVKASEVKRVIGDDLQEDIPFETILDELRKKFEVFRVLPNGTSYYDDPEVIDPLKKWFGQNFLKLENPEDIVEFIVSTIGINEGYDINDIKADLKDIGADEEAITRSSKALVALSSAKGVTKTATIKGKLPKTAAADAVERV